MELKPKVLEALNNQIGMEYQASLAYDSIGSYFTLEELPQLAKFFFKQSTEERDHAHKLIKFVLDRDGKISYPAIPAPQFSFASPVDAVNAACANEKKVSESIYKLYELANTEKDYATASRSFGGVNPTPTATPSPGGTPVASGGCLSVNPNPAAGSYSGDGGCGISTVVYRTSGQNVILEPFGANGAASFVVSPANSSSATSANPDLTVKGEAGYSCSLACSPPGTFSVTCFKEGGTTCNEKF